MRQRILCLRFPAWPLQRLVVSKRELRETASQRAIVIHRRDARRSDLVHICSTLAWQQGVRPGMPLSEAKALFAEEQNVCFIAHDPAKDLRWLARIAAWCDRYSPLVGWNTIASGRKEVLASLPPNTEPEALYLDITGIGSLFGSEAALAEELLSGMTTRGLSARIGIANTPGAAWAVTMTKQRSPVIVESGCIEQAIAPLTIDALRLSPAAVATLQHLGVVTIEQLLALPRKGLVSRFDSHLVLRIDQALGEASELIGPHRPPPVFQAEWLLEHPTDRRNAIEAILRQLVDQLSHQLSQRQQGAAEIVCRLGVAGRSPLVFEVGLYRPTASPRHLLELLLMQLERVKATVEVGRIGIAATRTAPLATYQTRLFDDLSSHCTRTTAALLDRLSSRLGADAVLKPILKSHALPECAIELLPAVQEKPKRTLTTSRFAASHRPLLLLERPLKLDVLAVMPDGPPIRFQFERRQYQVARHWGAERIETRWWKGHSVRRDYYRVETTVGTRFWLFRELHEGMWFLHGVFE